MKLYIYENGSPSGAVSVVERRALKEALYGF
jgi:hypothetical protein